MSFNTVLERLNSYNDTGQDPNKLSVTFYSSIGGGTASDILGSNPLSNQDLFAGTGGYSFQHSGSFLYWIPVLY